MKALILGLSLFVSFCWIDQLFAAEVPRATYKHKGFVDSKVQQLLNEAKQRGLKRSVSGTEVPDESLMSKELKEFRDQFLKVNTGEDLEALFEKYSAPGAIDTYPTDLQYALVQFNLLRPFRGIIYRLVPLVKNTNAVHSMLITLIQSLASNMRIFFPTSNWEAGFAYVTEPFVNNQKQAVQQFKTTRDLQIFCATDVFNALDQAAARLENMSLTKQSIIWDNRFVFGRGTFEDALSRYRKLGEADRYLTLGSLYLGMNYISAFVAYDIDNVFKLLKTEGQLYGLDGFVGIFPNQGVPSLKRVAVLCGTPDCVADTSSGDWVEESSGLSRPKSQQWKPEYQSLFTLNSNGRWWMQNMGLPALKKAVLALRIAWTEIEKQPGSEFAIWDSARILPWNRQIKRSLEDLEAMVSGERTIVSPFTNEKVTINLPQFYNNPPQDLKKFLPIQWEMAPETKTKEGMNYRNYFWGRAIGWNLSEYQPYLKISSNADLLTAARVLNQSFGGWAVANPVSFMVQ